MLKLIKLTAILLLLVSVNFAQSPFLTLMADDGITYEPETLAYQLRVEADGGEVIDIDAVNNFYLDAKANDYLDTLICALLYTGGVKKSNDSLFTWYDLTANENDFVCGFEESQVSRAPFYSSINGVGGNTQPSMLCILTYNQPTAYYSITKRTNVAGYTYFWGAISNHGLLQDGASDNFYLYAGNDFIPAKAYADNDFELYRMVYAGTSSSAQVDNGTVYTGNAGTQNLSSTNFTIINTDPNTYFKSFIITPRLSTAKDLALKNILNTIYPTY